MNPFTEWEEVQRELVIRVQEIMDNERTKSQFAGIKSRAEVLDDPLKMTRAAPVSPSGQGGTVVQIIPITIEPQVPKVVEHGMPLPEGFQPGSLNLEHASGLMGRAMALKESLKLIETLSEVAKTKIGYADLDLDQECVNQGLELINRSGFGPDRFVLNPSDKTYLSREKLLQVDGESYGDSQELSLCGWISGMNAHVSSSLERGTSLAYVKDLVKLQSSPVKVYYDTSSGKPKLIFRSAIVASPMDDNSLVKFYFKPRD